MDLISVIVPVYKVEKYLDKCIESIVNQTYKNLEIILVDDGSPDRCPQICDAWAKSDSRIKVIHQENAGGGAARNRGIEIAKGEYISFIDSDDYISTRMYEILLSYFDENTDIVECDILNTYTDNSDLYFSGENIKTETYSTEQALNLHIHDKLFRQTPPNKLYRRDIVEGVLFPIGKRIDDEFWTYRVIANSKNLKHIYVPMYAYRQQEDSVMHTQFSLERLQALEAKVQRLEYICEYYPKLENDALVNLWYTSLFLGQMSLLYLSPEERTISFMMIDNAFKRFRLFKKIINILPLKQKVWGYMSCISFKTTCQIRNCLKKGI